MKRRDSLKSLTLSSLGIAALSPQVALAEQRELEMQNPPETPLKVPGGRLKEEAIRDAKIAKEKFLTVAELADQGSGRHHHPGRRKIRQRVTGWRGGIHRLHCEGHAATSDTVARRFEMARKRVAQPLRQRIYTSYQSTANPDRRRYCLPSKSEAYSQPGCCILQFDA